MDSLVDVVARLGGSAYAAQLLQLTTERKLRAAVQSGELERVARGHYALPSLGPDRLAALAYDGVASHVSAAHLWGLPLRRRPEKPHVTVPVDRRVRGGRPAVLHWGAGLVRRAIRADHDAGPDRDRLRPHPALRRGARGG